MLQLAALKALPLKWIGLAILVAALVVQTLRLDAAQERAKRYKAEIAEMKDRAKAEANRQKQVTADNIAKTRDRIVKVEVPAKRVENAPLPGNCQTPREILEADL